jgi:hypothetical protein
MALDREDLQQLEASIVRALKIPTSGKTANNLFNSSAADFKEAIKRQIEKMQDLGKQYGVSETQLIKFRLMAEENTKELAESSRTYVTTRKALNTAVDGIKNFSDASQTGADTFATFTSAFKNLPLLGLLHEMGGSFDFNIGIFRNLSSVGADFGKSLVGMRQASADARLPLLEFKDLVIGNAQNLAALYGTVGQGVAGLASFTEQLRTQGIPQLAQLGITTEGLNDFFSTYLGIQRTDQRFSQMTQQQVVTGTIAYAKELDRLAKLTGVQREVLDEKIKMDQADSVFAAFTAGLSEEQAIQARQLVATLGSYDEALGQSAKNFIATGVPFDELSQRASALVPGFSDAIMAFRNGSIGVDDALKRIQLGAQGFRDTIKDPAVLLGGDLKGLGDAFLKISTATINSSAATAQQRVEADRLTKSLAEFNESAKRLKTGFESIQTAVFAGLGNAFSGFINGTNTAFIGISNAIISFTKSAPGATAGLLAVGLAGKYLFDYATQVMIIAAGVKLGQFGLTKFLGGLAGTFTSTLGTVGGMFLKLAVPLAAIVGVLSSLAMLFDAKTRGQGAGGIAGAVGGGMAAAAIGRMIGGTIGTFLGGPLGTVAGIAIGTVVGQLIGGLFDDKGRALGTAGATGQLLEPKNAITQIHKGEMVLNKPQAAALVNNAVSPNLDLDGLSKTIRDSNQKLGDISTNIERNTQTAAGVLAQINAGISRLTNTVATKGNLV